MATARIEDDDFQLKVPRDQIPPVRAVDVAGRVEASGPLDAARKLLGTTPTTATPTTATPTTATPTTATTTASTPPKQPPGLAFRALHDAAKKREP